MLMGLPAAVACAAQPAPGPESPPLPPVPFSLQAMVQAARDDAARRTGVDAAALQLVSARPLVWPNGALGCPLPGRSYTMALVGGYRIELLANGQPLDYHASDRGALLLCPPGQGVDAPVKDMR
jgi:hypothetical protein